MNLSIVSIRRSGADAARASKTSPEVALISITYSLLRSILPVSRPSPISIVVIPVTLSPARTLLWIGAAPLYLGRSEPCTFMQANFGISRILLGRILP